MAARKKKKLKLTAQDKRYFWNVTMFPDGPEALAAMGRGVSDDVADREREDAFNRMRWLHERDDLREIIATTTDWLADYFVQVEGYSEEVAAHGRDTYVRYASGLIAMLAAKGVKIDDGE